MQATQWSIKRRVEPAGPAEAEAVCVDMEFVVDSGNIDVEMMFCEIWELLLALLLVKFYFDSVVCVSHRIAKCNAKG